MSLLLDAMKKTGDKAASLPTDNLTMEEYTHTPPRADSKQTRAAGENLFAAKKKKASPGFRWTLGLVPTTFIICSVIGSIYGFYVWRELNPPAPVMVQRRELPPPSPIHTPAPPALVANIAPEVMTKPAPAVAEVKPAPVEKSTTANAAPATSSSEKPTRAKPAPSQVAIAHQNAADTITPALLDAYQAYQRGDYVTASQGYRAVLQKDARNRDALLGLGAIAQQQAQDQAAQHYYRQVLLIDPRDPVALGAMSAYSTSNGVDAESNLKQLLSEQPRSGALNYALGNVYGEQSRWAEAQQAYFDAHTLEPTNAQFTYNLAVSLDHLSQSKQAAQYYQQALQLDPAKTAGFDHTQAQQRLNELTTSR